MAIYQYIFIFAVFIYSIRDKVWERLRSCQYKYCALYYVLSQPAWDVSERSQSDLHWERHLWDFSEISQKRQLFCDVFKTSQKHLKKDVFCITPLGRLELISKNMSFPWHLWDVSETSLASICDFSKIPHRMVSCDLCRVTEIFDKIDVGPLETLKKRNVFWEQCIVINQVCHEYQLADICVRILAS